MPCLRTCVESDCLTMAKCFVSDRIPLALLDAVAPSHLLARCVPERERPAFCGLACIFIYFGCSLERISPFSDWLKLQILLRPWIPEWSGLAAFRHPGIHFTDVGNELLASALRRGGQERCSTAGWLGRPWPRQLAPGRSDERTWWTREPCRHQRCARWPPLGSSGSRRAFPLRS